MRSTWSPLALLALALASCGRTSKHGGASVSEATAGSANMAGSANVAGATSVTGAGGDAPLDCAGAHPGPKPLVTLTNYQLNRTLGELFPGAASLAALTPLDEARRESPQDEGFGDASDLHTWAHDAAEALSKDAPALSALGGCQESDLATIKCRDQLIERLASRAFRHALSDDERSELGEVFVDGEKLGGSFDSGVRAVIEVVLQSPEFLYLIELGNGRAEGDSTALSGYESAARLALFLTGTLPDAELAEVAASGELSAEVIEQQARRLLGSPGSREQTRHFYANLLRFVGDYRAAPDYDSAMVALAREESGRFIEDVSFDGAGTFRALLTEPSTWVNERLAKFYGYPGVSGDAFQKVQLDPAQRGGLLTQSAFLTGNSHSNSTSPVWRGQTVLRKLLCWDGPTPPVGVIKTPPPPDDSATTREKLEAFTSEPVCQSCHKVIDPVGFAFEHYDQRGLYRTTENDKPIDASGELLLSDASGPFADALELMKRLAESSDAKACLTSKWLEQAQGRPTTEQDGCAQQSALGAFTESDGKLSELMVAIAKTDGFRYRLSSELLP
ncbi:MAG TPA: DUF1588 domain-containing protein [Polyangiaceae bacterium]|nr:DUF1588 domain-containing protein [Polyangiaceae bacterium]